EAVAWPAEGTSLVVAPDAFSITVATMFKLAKSCEAKSFENSGFKKDTRRSTEVIEPEPLTLEFEPILKMEDVGLKCLQPILEMGDVGLKCLQVHLEKYHECEAVAWPAEGTSLVVAPDAFSITVATLFKVSVTLFNKLGRESKVFSFSELKIFYLANQETLLEVPIEYSSVQQPRSSLISLDNSVNFEGSFFSSVGKQLAESCEAKRFENSGFKEDTRSVNSSGPLKIGKYFHFSLCSGTETEEGLWKSFSSAWLTIPS
nr:hypothetical protein [Tanacetum cinerariifolium]